VGEGESGRGGEGESGRVGEGERGRVGEGERGKGGERLSEGPFLWVCNHTDKHGDDFVVLILKLVFCSLF
jgi:hypothetical protein